jgi:phosphatidylserine decarboxylase
MKIASEGWPFVIGSVMLTLLVYLLTRNYSVVVPVLLTLFMVYFFRDPERTSPPGKDTFVSPADGKVIVVKDVFEPVYLKAKVKQISIFMSPLNVHVNRSPAEGKVIDVVHRKGNFRAAYSDAAADSNESTSMILETEQGAILVRQVAGIIARRIVCRSKPGDILLKGQRYGLIKFSSRVDLFLPEDVQVEVSVDQPVKAGETVLARKRAGSE